MSERLDALLCGRYSIARFADLPPTSQLTMAHFMGVEGRAWAIPFPVIDRLDGSISAEQKLRYLQQLMPEVVRTYAEVRFGSTQIATMRLKRQVLADPQIAERFESWEPYSVAYQADRNAVDPLDAAIWPVILGSTDNETVQGGMDRLHVYCRAHLSQIPALFFPMPRHFRQLGLPAG